MGSRWSWLLEYSWGKWAARAHSQELVYNTGWGVCPHILLCLIATVCAQSQWIGWWSEGLKPSVSLHYIWHFLVLAVLEDARMFRQAETSWIMHLMQCQLLPIWSPAAPLICRLRWGKETPPPANSDAVTARVCILKWCRCMTQEMLVLAGGCRCWLNPSAKTVT